MNETSGIGIPLTMIYLDMVRFEENNGRRMRRPSDFVGRSGLIQRFAARRRMEPRRLPAQDEEEEALLFLLPFGLRRKPARLAARLEALYDRYPPRGLCWYEEEMREMLDQAFWRPALPESAWIHRLWQQEAFCPNLILVPPEPEGVGPDEKMENGTRWIREVLQNGYERLNGLLVLDGALAGSAASISLMDRHSYYQEIYEDTGLPAVCAGSLARMGWQARRGRTVCLDARCGLRIPHRELPEGTLYLDMTSEEGKRRLLAAKRKDICYRSALNCLDTYVRKRYNTNRCK